jgi:predicted DCC family thiol-disulfide oxidoreductase YuxK
MISLSSDITDTKGSRAKCGWVFFDRDCGVCIRLAQRFRNVLRKRGFGLAALQDPRAASLLAIPEEEMLREMRVVTADGGRYGGADAIVYLAGRIWWAWPLYLSARVPGVQKLLEAGYQWFAAHRHCSSIGCKVATADRGQDFRTAAKGDAK